MQVEAYKQRLHRMLCILCPRLSWQCQVSAFHLIRFSCLEINAVVKKVIGISCFDWNILEKLTLHYKIHKPGHCDLIGQKPVTQGVYRPRVNPVKSNIQIFPEQMTRFTFIPIRHVLTSGDLRVGHSDLDPYMLVEPTEANNNTINIQLDYLLVV